MDFLSVIIPAFNSERWLENCLRSVREAIDTDCEVIIVNDGSTDDTHNIARRFVDEDPRFSLIDIEHVGPCAARKAGFEESQGDYIMFVDSDDYLPPTSIKDQRRLLDESAEGEGGVKDRSKVTEGRPKIIIANTVARTGNVDKLLVSGGLRALTGMEYAREILEGTIPGFLAGHFYARDLVEAIDWDDSPDITHQENFYLLLSFAMKLNEQAPDKRQVIVAPTEICYRYLRRAGSQSALMALTPNGLERVWHHINNLGLPEPELTIWGLKMLKRVFIDRGIPFSTNYSVAVDLRKRGLALGEDLPTDLRETVEALGSQKKRTKIANELARTAGLTSMRPHLTVIVICRHNVKKVERTVASVFEMGFRNLEVVIVDMGNSHNERVILNQMSIRFARVRIVKIEPQIDIYRAAVEGLAISEGLSVTFARPGDLCCATGLYDAVTRIDYGADAVMPNYRDYDPLTRLRGRIHSYAELRSTEKSRNAESTAANATEDVYEAVLKGLNEPEDNKNTFFIYGTVWRTDFLKESIHNFEISANVPIHTISHAFLHHVMKERVRVVTQDKTTGPAFEYANESFFKRFLMKLIPWKKTDPFLPKIYG